MAVAPTPVAAAPDAPDRAQRATFSARATAFFDWIKNTFVAGVNALASNVYANAQDAASSAANAVAQSASATAQAGIATAQAAAATSAAATATTQAGVATTQAASITTAAATSTAKADVATAKAAEATAAAATATAVTLGVSTGYPAMRPTLNLDFANSRYVDPRITFNRASTATRTNEKGLAETVAANVPRIDCDPVTLACRGLLIEESRTNILAYSEQFDHASWTKGNSSISANAITAPDGSLTADKLVESASTGSHRAYRTTAGTTNTSAYTASVAAQAGERSRIYLAQIEGQTFSRQGNTVLDLSSGAIVSASMGLNGATGGAATITTAGNGWYRCAYTLIAGGTDTSLLYDIITVNGVSPNYAGDGTSGIYTWGAQLEAGAFATSYIPTTAAAATRAADVAVMTASNFSSWYRQDEGAFIILARRDSLSAGRLITLSDGTANNQIRINLAVSSTSLRADLEVTTGGVSQVSTTTTPVFAVGSMVAIAFAYKADDFAISVNGTTVVTDTSGTVPTVDRMHIGTDHAGANSHNGTVAHIAYYPKRPTNLELQALSVR